MQNHIVPNLLAKVPTSCHLLHRPKVFLSFAGSEVSVSTGLKLCGVPPAQLTAGTPLNILCYLRKVIVHGQVDEIPADTSLVENRACSW